MNFPNYMASILFKGNTDDKPPHPVEPYGSRQLLNTKAHRIGDAFLDGYFESFAGIHSSDEVLAGKPQPQGPKKPIRPQPFDPYGSKKPSMACAIDGIDHGGPTKTLPFGNMAHTLAQLLEGHVTANKSTAV